MKPSYQYVFGKREGYDRSILSVKDANPTTSGAMIYGDLPQIIEDACIEHGFRTPDIDVVYKSGRNLWQGYDSITRTIIYLNADSVANAITTLIARKNISHGG